MTAPLFLRLTVNGLPEQVAINVAWIKAIAPLNNRGSIIYVGSARGPEWHVLESVESIISAIRGAGGRVVDVPPV
jgi:hypothetical protein